MALVEQRWQSEAQLVGCTSPQLAFIDGCWMQFVGVL
jgi:hypothetical protein